MTTENATGGAGAPSPLAEAKPDSLEDLFARMDEHIRQRTLSSQVAQQTLSSVVAALRAQRANWAKAEAEGAQKAPKRTSGVKTTLGDLGLD